MALNETREIDNLIREGWFKRMGDRTQSVVHAPCAVCGAACNGTLTRTNPKYWRSKLLLTEPEVPRHPSGYGILLCYDCQRLCLKAGGLMQFLANRVTVEARAAASEQTDEPRLAKKAAPPAEPKRYPLGIDEVIARLRPMLEDLPQLYPYGMSAGAFSEHFGLEMTHAYAAINGLAEMGEAAWLDAEGWGEGSNKLFFVRGMLKRPPKLTPPQEAVFHELCNRAEDGAVELRYTDIARSIGSSQTSVLHMCDAIEGKGYLKRRRREHYNAPLVADVIALQPTEPPIMKRVRPTPRHASKIATLDEIHNALLLRDKLLGEVAYIDAFLAMAGEMVDD